MQTSWGLLRCVGPDLLTPASTPAQVTHGDKARFKGADMRSRERTMLRKWKKRAADRFHRFLYKVPKTQLPIGDLVLQNGNHKKMERVDGKGLQGRVYGWEKEKKKLKDVKEEINGHSLIQTRTWWTGFDKRKRERERESSISQVTWNTNTALSQDLYHSWRHRPSSQGGLESLGKKVSSVGFHALPRMKTERRPQWTQVLSGARVFY